MKVKFITPQEIKRIRESVTDPFHRASLLAAIFRVNTLSMIREAGSGHIGSSFSSMDIITWLWTQELVNPNEKDKDPSDIYFSSKGHDVPALYSLLIGLGKLPFELIHQLRRLGGLPGHPDVGTPYIVTNTGSLGMGISKARGMVQAKRLQGRRGRCYILTGDGELQEGQIWESLQPTANGRFSEITVIVDCNKIQSDLLVENTSDLGEIERKFEAFGWAVKRINGHNFSQIKDAIAWAKDIKDKPQVIIADTVKGKGVSFMERLDEDGLYKFHSGAPSAEHYAAGLEELLRKLNTELKQLGVKEIVLEEKEIHIPSLPQNVQKLVVAYGDELVKIARERKDIVAMDADLVLDTGLVPFKKEFPDRYIECGIAEQDMVSFAGGMALNGVIPVVHSFECFLSARANEHFYNNATEKTKIIYVGSLAGLLPATPGHSHQSVRGISVLGSIPYLTLLQPCNEEETRKAIRWAVEENSGSTYIRLVSIPCDCPFELPRNYRLQVGRGIEINPGRDVLIIAYGPVMVSEAVKAARLLASKNISVAVMNFPWLNRVDEEWLFESTRHYRALLTLDDHYLNLGLGTQIRSVLAGYRDYPTIISLGLTDIPACGQNSEVLRYHKLDFESIAKSIETFLHSPPF